MLTMQVEIVKLNSEIEYSYFLQVLSEKFICVSCVCFLSRIYWSEAVFMYSTMLLL